MNQRLVILSVLALATLLAGCGPAPSPVAQVTEAPQVVSASPTAAPTATAVVAQASPSPAATEAFPTPNPNPQCKAVPITSDQNIQPVAADEWSRGPADAEITLIEYGDFQ